MKKMILTLAAMMVAGSFGEVMAQEAPTPHRIGTAEPTSEPLWAGVSGQKPPDGEFRCEAGQVPVVQGTTKAIDGGVAAQNRLDGERARRIAPAVGWDGSWASTGSTVIENSTAVWCVEPREVKLSLPDPCQWVRLDPRYAAAETGTVDGDVNRDGTYDAEDCQEAVRQMVVDAAIVQGPCDHILSQYPAVGANPAGDVDEDGDYDAEDCDAHLRSMIPPAAAPTPKAGPCDYVVEDYPAEGKRALAGDVNRDGGYDSKDCAADKARSFLELVRVGVQVGWGLGFARQDIAPDNGPIAQVYLGLDVGQFWLEGSFGGGADVRGVGKAYARPWHIRGTFVAGFMTPGERHRVRLGFGVGSRSTGPHLVAFQKEGGGIGTEILGDGSNRLVGVLKVAWQPVAESRSWHFQVFLEGAWGAVEFPTMDGQGRPYIDTGFGWWAHAGIRLGIM